MEWIVHFAFGSVSFGFDCQAGLPLAKMMARSSPPPLGLATTASKSSRVLVLVASRPCASSQAAVPWANAALPNAIPAAASHGIMRRFIILNLLLFMGANLPRRSTELRLCRTGPFPGCARCRMAYASFPALAREHPQGEDTAGGHAGHARLHRVRPAVRAPEAARHQPERARRHADRHR